MMRIIRLLQVRQKGLLKGYNFGFFSTYTIDKKKCNCEQSEWIAKQMAKKEVKKSYLILYLSIVVVCLFLVICRWISTVNPNLTILPEIIDIHVTNFSLSLMLSIFIGFTGIDFRWKNEDH